MGAWKDQDEAALEAAREKLEQEKAQAESPQEKQARLNPDEFLIDAVTTSQLKNDYEKFMKKGADTFQAFADKQFKKLERKIDKKFQGSTITKEECDRLNRKLSSEYHHMQLAFMYGALGQLTFHQHNKGHYEADVIAENLTSIANLFFDAIEEGAVAGQARVRAAQVLEVDSIEDLLAKLKEVVGE